MKQGFGVTAVMCTACGVTVSLQPPAFVEKVEAIEEIGTKVLADGHIQQKAICSSKSKMFIFFVLAMASDGMFEPEKPLGQIMGLNGKALAH